MCPTLHLDCVQVAYYSDTKTASTASFNVEEHNSNGCKQRLGSNAFYLLLLSFETVHHFITDLPKHQRLLNECMRHTTSTWPVILLELRVNIK